VLRIDHERTEQIFSNRDVKLYLFRLFELSGLFGNVDIQGAWTVTLLPKTNGGRWFTLNIGSHEVAFSTKNAAEGKVQHFIVLDRLILEYPEIIIWIGKRDGSVEMAEYVAAERAVVVNFTESFANAERLFALPGVRRALIAYWAEALADLRQRKAKSVTRVTILMMLFPNSWNTSAPTTRSFATLLRRFVQQPSEVRSLFSHLSI
jgi:hypothetical protein